MTALSEYLDEIGARGIIVVPFDVAKYFNVSPGDVLRAAKELGWVERKTEDGKFGWVYVPDDSIKRD
jgi:bifunctional DNA-binding transcriptional regulator/antitoxin component of YhaV-PrlF toxin-antitoxin module